jgi:Tol biopolymer transport system component
VKPSSCLAVLLSLSVVSSISLQSSSNSIAGVSLTDLQPGGVDLGGGSSWVEDVTPDGRFVVWVSTAQNLVPEEASGDILNVYVLDRVEARTGLVSVNREGTGGGNGHSGGARISMDGRFVVFESYSDNLVWGDGNGFMDLFLRDLVEQRTELITVAADGGGSGNGASWWPTITPDGSRVAFVSAASNLVAHDNNGVEDVFLRDVSTGTTWLASTGMTSRDNDPFNPGMRDKRMPLLSADGRHVVFTAFVDLSALVLGSRGFTWTVFSRDMELGTAAWVGTNVAAITGSSVVRCYNTAVSADGAWVAFKLEQTRGRVLRHHVPSMTTQVVATNAVVNGITVEDTSGPVMTPDGRFIVYASQPITSGWNQIQRWDAESGETQLVSVNWEGTAGGNGLSDTPRISADGRHVWFLSHATNLLEELTDSSSKLYVRDMDLGITTLLTQPEADGHSIQDVVWPLVAMEEAHAYFDVAGSKDESGRWNIWYDVFGSDFHSGDPELVSLGLPGTRSVTSAGLIDLHVQGVSADGRFVAFSSYAEDLVSNDANRTGDVFVRDLLLGNTALASVNRDGATSGNALSRASTLSADGRYVAFESWATDLVENDINQRPDIFVRDLVQEVTSMVSVNREGTGSAERGASAPIISADGRHVAFLSSSSDLVEPVPSYRNSVFVRDLEAGVTRLAGSDRPEWGTWGFCDQLVLASDGRSVLFRAGSDWFHALYRTDLETGLTVRVDKPITPGEDPDQFRSGGASLSENGRWAVFISTHPSLVDQDENEWADLFLRDFLTGTTLLITTNIAGTSGNGDAFEAVMSADGQWVAFTSAANDLVLNDPSRGSAVSSLLDRDVFLYEVEAGRTTLVSRSAWRDQSGNGPSDQVALSADGRFFAFQSEASDLVAGDDNGWKDVFVHDRSTGITTLASANRMQTSSANRSSHRPALSADGTVLVMKSYANDLIAQDWNQAADLFWTPLTAPRWLSSFLADIEATSAEQVRIRWRGVVDGIYRVEYRDLLTAGEWLPLEAQIMVADGWARAEDMLPVGTRARYYRVLWAP